MLHRPYSRHPLSDFTVLKIHLPLSNGEHHHHLTRLVYSPYSMEGMDQTDADSPVDFSYHMHPEKNSTSLERTLTWFTGFSCAAAIVLNGLILTVYILQASLRSPFNAYIANLAAAEILYSLLGTPWNIVRNLYGYWPLSFELCSFYLYASYVLNSAIRYGHLLVTFNRVWAVTFPIHYREKHSYPIARTLIYGTWCLLHALHLPLLIRGRLRPDETDAYCVLNVSFQWRYSIVVEIIGFSGTEVVMLLACFFILFKVMTNRSKREVPVKSGRLRHSATETDSLHSTLTVQQLNLEKNSCMRICTNTHNRFLVYLMVAVIVCWTPNHVYWLMVGFGGYWNTTFCAIQNFAIITNSWLNPILCYLALTKFQVAINSLFKYRRKARLCCPPHQ
ncbi:5-hydroxytryptamine receptor 1B-like [Paramacrobiotus metropolitanus]|uniref:5-hydroxytryptamine receptor 1B-like n=1 Tax=Paramacrobiotus metropolitanus TaxID=2943436 RepID=UPI002445C5B3|nr:5-hydroxytryptamine receptor 1B-like [Paramacrobiotus metropolitanus]